MASYSNQRKRGRTKMKNWLWRGTLAAVIALPALSGIARAQSSGPHVCTNATLKGDYAFSVIDFTSPLVVVGIGTFDGKGGFSQVDYRGDSLATTGATDFSGGGTGSYKGNLGCTVSPIIKFDDPRPSRPHGGITDQGVNTK